MDAKTKGKILNALRKLTYSYPPRNAVKERAKVDKALYQCETCCTYCYEGTSDTNFANYLRVYKDNIVVKRRVEVDHIHPMIAIVSGWTWSWDDIINRLFCEEEGMQLLCELCHDEKTREENEQRKLLRKEKK